MINRKEGWAFLHPPKTGGSSVESVLTGKPVAAHHTHRAYRDLLDTDAYFFFATVRNPFARVVSEYFWSTNVTHEYPEPEYKQFFKGLSFKGFVQTFYRLKYKDVYQFMDRYFFDQHHQAHCMSQVEFLNPVKHLDLVIKCEDLQSGFNVFCDAVGRETTNLPCVYETKHKHYSAYYDDELVDLVSEMFKEDLETFDYSFEKESNAKLVV